MSSQNQLTRIIKEYFGEVGVLILANMTKEMKLDSLGNATTEQKKELAKRLKKEMFETNFSEKHKQMIDKRIAEAFK